MKRLEFQSHFVRGLLLVTDLPPAALEPAAEAGAGGSGSESDRQQRQDAAAAGRSLVRSTARRGEPRRAVRHRRPGARGDRAVRRHGVFGGAADERDRHTDGARRRSRECPGHGAARRLPASASFGLALGLPLAVGAGYLLSAQLYGVRFWDPLALGVSAVSLAACAFVAALIPARRAASISPIRALRSN